MSALNKIMVIGRLTRDPEVRFTPKGTAVAEIGIAVNRTWTDNGERKEEVTFLDITLWGKVAEISGQYLKKGSSCYIEGRLQLDTWDDKETGQKRSKLKIVGENVQFLDSKPDGQSSAQPSRRPANQPTRPANSQPDGDEDDIPW